jgi:uncharacterized membrane protein
MIEDILPMVVTSVVFGSIILVIKIISDNRIRRILIESGQLDEKAKFLYLKGEKSACELLSSVKWGMVMIGIGLALLIGQLFPESVSEGMTIGFMFLFAGIAFLIYYAMKKKQSPEQPLPAEE